MKLKLANNLIVSVTEPTEQKLYKKEGNILVGAGWVLSFAILTPLSTVELDEAITSENLTGMELLNDDETQSSPLVGYVKMTSCTIRHLVDLTSVAEIQLSKTL